MAALLALAGCIGDGPASDDGTIRTMSAEDDVFLVAEDATFTGSFMASVHGAPMEEVPLPLCEPPAQCHVYDIPVVAQDAAGNTVEDVVTTATTWLDAHLTWGSPATDLNLHLLRDGVEVAWSADGHVGVTPHFERISEVVGPGDYQLMVVGWYVVMDAYELEVTFDLEPAGPEERA